MSPTLAILIGPVRLAISIAIGVALLAVLAFLLAFREGRKTLQKFYYLTRNLFGIDIGLGGAIRLLLLSAVPAVAVAFVKGLTTTLGFDWHLFIYALLGLLALNVINNFLGNSMSIRDFFSPKSGRKWHGQRKSAQAGIIKRININIASGTISETEIRSILSDILDVIVLHVRDYRGSHQDKKKEVFASLLIEQGDDVVVVARDSLSHTSQYERRIPAVYSKALMLCGRAMAAKKALSIGKLRDEYPEGPQNKPYASILAIPLFSSDGDRVFGCVSVDCSKPYFFQSFTPDQVENDLENSLQPYLQLITMVSECFVGRDNDQLQAGLIQLAG